MIPFTSVSLRDSCTDPKIRKLRSHCLREDGGTVSFFYNSFATYATFKKLFPRGQNLFSKIFKVK